jgi:ABC-type multidrug transport system fused ATPase/permease subunit
MGASMPVYAILFGEVLGLLSKPIDVAREESVFYSIMFLVVGVVVGLAMFLQVAMFTVAGEHLTLRMRKMAFAAMLRQEMGWFDLPTNNTGALCARLSADASAIQGVSVQALTTVNVRAPRIFRVFPKISKFSNYFYFSSKLFYCSCSCWGYNVLSRFLRLLEAELEPFCNPSSPSC